VLLIVSRTRGLGWPTTLETAHSFNWGMAMLHRHADGDARDVQAQRLGEGYWLPDAQPHAPVRKWFRPILVVALCEAPGFFFEVPHKGLHEHTASPPHHLVLRHPKRFSEQCTSVLFFTLVTEAGVIRLCLHVHTHTPHDTLPLPPAHPPMGNVSPGAHRLPPPWLSIFSPPLCHQLSS